MNDPCEQLLKLYQSLEKKLIHFPLRPLPWGDDTGPDAGIRAEMDFFYQQMIDQGCFQPAPPRPTIVGTMDGEVEVWTSVTTGVLADEPSINVVFTQPSSDPNQWNVQINVLSFNFGSVTVSLQSNQVATGNFVLSSGRLTLVNVPLHIEDSGQSADVTLSQLSTEGSTTPPDLPPIPGMDVDGSGHLTLVGTGSYLFVTVWIVMNMTLTNWPT